MHYGPVRSTEFPMRLPACLNLYAGIGREIARALAVPDRCCQIKLPAPLDGSILKLLGPYRADWRPRSPGPAGANVALRAAESASGTFVPAATGSTLREYNGCQELGRHPIRMFQNQDQALFAPSCVTRHRSRFKSTCLLVLYSI
jgi:hypothetical protein